MTVAPEPAWPTKRLKYVVSLRRERVDNPITAGRPYLGLEHIQPSVGRLVSSFASSDHFQPTSSETSVGTTFECGDVLFGKLRPYLAKVWLAEFPGRCTTELLAMQPRSLDRGFLLYVLLSRSFVHAVNASTFGSKMPRTDWSVIGNLQILLPPIPKQRAIADYLHRETAHLDGLVAQKQRILRLLAERRQTLITRAVTGGLDPVAPMRDSGVPCLGRIPAHWTVTRLKFVADVRSGLALSRRTRPLRSAAEYPYLSVANVQDGYLDLLDIKTVHLPTQEAESFALRDGDVLMNEGGDDDKLGRGCIWRGEIAPCLHQNHVFVVRPRRIRSEWLNLWTSSEPAKSYFQSRAKRATNLASISASNVRELPLPVPPAEEEKEIMERVTSAGAKLDKARAAAVRTLRLLDERRSALISAAVTGQIDIGEFPC